MPLRTRREWGRHLRDATLARLIRRHRAAAAENRHSPPVLRPARDIIAHSDGAFFSIGDRAQTARIDALRSEEVFDRLGTPCTQRDIVFARAALVGVPLDGDRVA